MDILHLINIIAHTFDYCTIKFKVYMYLPVAVTFSCFLSGNFACVDAPSRDGRACSVDKLLPWKREIRARVLATL